MRVGRRHEGAGRRRAGGGTSATVAYVGNVPHPWKDNQQYIRKSVRCPLHLDCRKYRNCHQRQCARLGDLEPIAYLGLWLKDAHCYPDKKSHHQQWTEPSEERMKDLGF